MKFIYCIKGDYLEPCEGKDEKEYYIFEYTRDLQLIISKCLENDCKEIEAECLNLKFNLPEAEIVSKLLEKLSTFRSFLQKNNIKVYFLEDSSVLEAVINPKLYYYKYLGIQDDIIRKKKIDELKIWTLRFLLLVDVLEDLQVEKFLSHLDSLDGRYALWIKENSDEPAAVIITRKLGEVKVWLAYKGCDLLIKNKDQMCYKIEYE